MFAKHWTAGEVKTRLAAAVGEDRAARLHRIFVQHLCRTVGPPGIRRQVVFSPPTKLATSQAAFANDWQWVPQADGDLGCRMQTWFEQTSRRNETLRLAGEPDQAPSPGACAMVIGSDCPTVSNHSLRKALDHLKRNEIVIGPAIDGGYYLLGMRLSVLPRTPSLFANVPWSSDQVLSVTLRNANRSGLSIGLLEPKEDIDTWDSLQNLRDQLAGSSDSDRRVLNDEISAALKEGD